MYSTIASMFIYCMKWIIPIYPPKDHTSAITLVYKDREYSITDRNIVQWFQENESDVIDIPESIFIDIIGDAPDTLPGYIEGKGFNTSIGCKQVLDLVTLCILLDYIGVVNLVWELHYEIFKRRSELPSHWKDIAGLRVIKDEYMVLKWDGEQSPYSIIDFNGFYTPFNIASTMGKRILLESQVKNISLVRELISCDEFQSLMFNPIDISSIHVKPYVAGICTVLNTGRWDFFIDIIDPLSLQYAIRLIPPAIVIRMIRKYISNIIGQEEAFAVANAIYSLPDELTVEVLDMDTLIGFKALKAAILDRFEEDRMIHIASFYIQKRKICLKDIISNALLYSYLPEDVKNKICLPSNIENCLYEYHNDGKGRCIRMQESPERIEMLESIPEEQLLAFASNIGMDIPIEDGEPHISSLIEKISTEIDTILSSEEKA